jgi:2'-5' RNA ligase
VAETALVVLVPELEPLVGHWRRSSTDDGARGMPPHVTLIYPFADDGDVERYLHAADRVFAEVASFEVAFTGLRRWPDVLYLAPEPAEPFVALVERLTGAFPDYLPYGGAYDEIVPHLTLAQGDDVRFDEIETAVRPFLPLRVRVERAWLMAETSEGWRRHTSFPLAGGRGQRGVSPTSKPPSSS